MKTVGWLILLGPLLTCVPGVASESMNRGDAAWARRSEGHDGHRASPQAVLEAFAAYQLALEEDPDSVTARLGALKALAFQGEYTETTRAEKVAIFARGKKLAEESIDRMTSGFAGNPRPRWRDQAGREQLALFLDDQPDAVGIYLLSAYHWGLWARYRGRLAAVRQGVAGKLRDYAGISLTLDPLYLAAGPHRLLGRLHHEAPRIPFFTGWVDKRIAVTHLTRAMELGPGDYLGRLFWVETVLAYQPSRRSEALAELRRLAELTPRAPTLAEDLDALEKARTLLAEVEE